MKILYISSVPSKKQFEYMQQNLKNDVDVSKYGMQESGFKFHHLIIDGILQNKDNTVYSLVGRAVSRKTHSGLYWKNEKEIEENLTYEHIGFLNIPVIKNLIISLSYFFKTMRWISKNKSQEKCIIIDAAYITVIPFINLATKIKKCKKVSIVCDIYEYMADVKDAREKSSKIHTYIAKFMKKNYEQIDGFVFLTEAMNNVLNIKNKPYIVMEGLVDINMSVSENDITKKSKKDVVMYAGALRAQYGLKNLVEGFNKYKNKNAELWIFGAGDYADSIKEIQKKDKRIKYYGIVSNKEVVEKELEADILINPRPSNQEFTKYSFPSKNMEYMVSGTPVLSTKLPGMPKEYYKYIYLLEEDTPECITKMLEEIFNNSKEELHKKGIASKNFVLNKKNNVVQSKRILDLCSEVVNNENSKVFQKR